MKRLSFIALALSLVLTMPSNAQKGSLLKKVGNSMANELLGRKEKPEPAPEPKSACDQSETIMDLNGKYKIDYKEVNISVKDDGRVLVQDRMTDKYYIVQGTVTSGPFTKDDPRVAEFDSENNGDNSIDNFILRNKPYISKSGDKLAINFGGKTYGPFSTINNFTVSRTKEKFAAIVIENVVSNEAEAKKIQAEMEKAKTDQEKMDLAMKYGALMQERMVQGGGPSSMTPKLVTNVPDAAYDPLKSLGGTLSGKIKYDDILVQAYDKIIDLKGNTIFTVKPEVVGDGELFINSSNTKYAVFKYGTLTFSDKTTLPDLFNPYLTKADGKVFLAYMYYSPKKNAILQCKLPF
jgi:hypothetical protein